MEGIRHTVVLLLFAFFLMVGSGYCFAQNNSKPIILPVLSAAQLRALDLIDHADTVSVSVFWPHIRPEFFFPNLRNNILYPERLDQGEATNFCAYAALTHILISLDPELYVHTILSIYREGEAPMHKKKIRPSKSVREAAGTLKNKGTLEVHHADQLWFLSLADHFKGYLNLFNHKYKVSDEDNFWAATNLSKFNHMLREVGNNKVKGVGSDLLRPWKKSYYNYMVAQLQQGTVMLYINNKYARTSRYTMFRVPIPTHYVVLYQLQESGGLFDIQYWDYGLKTEQRISGKTLRKMTFGISRINNK